jgi:hypothetical protein
MALTSRELSKREYTGKCSTLLPNRMRCTKGASFEVIDDSTDPPTKTQHCRMHMRFALSGQNTAPRIGINNTDTVEGIKVKPTE